MDVYCQDCFMRRGMEGEGYEDDKGMAKRGWY